MWGLDTGVRSCAINFPSTDQRAKKLTGLPLMRKQYWAQYVLAHQLTPNTTKDSISLCYDGLSGAEYATGYASVVG